jgi:DNA-directed RNA polymerase subunit RPC12/RpoP
MNYLNNEQHYIDRYDIHTIEECLDTLKMFQDIYQKSRESEDLKHLTQEDILKDTNLMLHRTFFVIKGKRYEKKRETIQKWMEEDKLKQDKQDYTPTPEGIFCPLCNGSMYFNSSKHLDYTYDSPVMRMMFLFKCSKCDKQQWVYDDGEIRVSDPDLCPKCNQELNVTGSRKGKVITTLYKCQNCDYSKKDILDLVKSDEEHKKWQEEQKKKEEKDKELLAKYRAEFCLSDEEGAKYIETLEALEVGHEVYEEERQKYDDKAYQVAVNLKRLTVLEIEKLLSEKLEKEKYVKFTLDKPDMGRFVTIPFSVLDANSTRNPNISESTLKKLLKDTLEDTNWRLMSDGIHYRLGYLSGTLKAYEQEEDLLELFGAKKEVKPSKIDPEKRAKYMSNNLVQLAKMSGEFAGIEATRKRRLEKDPEGFFLDDGKGPYSCGICGDNYYGKDIWWNLDGLRCRDCWRNIKEGIIPSLKYRYDKYKNYFQDWELSSNFSLHSATARKLKREGLLHGRDLKRQDGSVYCTIYLMDENKEFLEKYPRKPKIEIEWKMKDDKGYEIKA